MKPTKNHDLPNLLKLGMTILAGFAVVSCASESDEPAPEEAAIEASAPASSIRDVTVAEAGALIGGEAATTVLDVRTPEEFAEGHIEGAINVNLLGDDFAEELSQLDPQATYVLHCKSGARSAKALEVMKKQGFADIAHMNEGFDGWTAAGSPVAQ